MIRYSSNLCSVLKIMYLRHFEELFIVESHDSLNWSSRASSVICEIHLFSIEI